MATGSLQPLKRFVGNHQQFGAVAQPRDRDRPHRRPRDLAGPHLPHRRALATILDIPARAHRDVLVVRVLIELLKWADPIERLEPRHRAGSYFSQRSDVFGRHS